MVQAPCCPRTVSSYALELADAIPAEYRPAPVVCDACIFRAVALGHVEERAFWAAAGAPQSALDKIEERQMATTMRRKDRPNVD
jgi:hypothetical protein